jgi:uncharacterized protein YdaU (DUF1376 family)
MAKMPAFQFYPGDWIQDTRILTLAAKGAWIDILCALWRSQTRGSLTLPLMGWARLLGCTADQAAAVITELVDMRICDSNLDESLSRGLLSGDRKAEVRLECRRMTREEKDRKINALCQQRHRSKGKSKAGVREEVRSLSSSSSSYPLISPNGGLCEEDLFEIFWSSYPTRRQTGRKNAFAEFRKLKPDREMLDRMLSALDCQKQSPDWLKEEGRYVPGIKKWLEDRYWERVPAELAVEARSRDEPGADPLWEYVVIDGHRYARRKTA